MRPQLRARGLERGVASACDPNIRSSRTCSVRALAVPALLLLLSVLLTALASLNRHFHSKVSLKLSAL